MKFFSFCIFFLLTGFVGICQTKLPNFFNDNMVLQQQQPVAIWGIDKPNKKVTVRGSWGNSSQTTTGSNGKWKLFLQTPKAGGPFTLTIKGSEVITFDSVLIGEVWLCSGQSNMEMPMKGYNNQPVIGSNEAILQSSNDQIRFFTTPRTVSYIPVEDVKSKWQPASPSTTGNFSATAYFFARKLQSVLGIPVGIIQTAWGGTNIESWMDSTSLAAFPHAVIPSKAPDTLPNLTPTIMYKSMLHPYIGYTIKGALWYQGESNRTNPHQYHELFKTMIASWRKQWQQGDFPFYFVQIAPYEPGKVDFALVREAQLKTMLTEKNVGMACLLDAGDKIIHPAQKEVVGNRLAYWALAKTYHVKGIAYSGPIYKQMRGSENGRVVLSFDFAEMGFSTFGKTLSDFEIAGEDRVFYPAQTRIVSNKVGEITVWNDSVPNPVSVRYGFKSWVEATLFNTAGLPASSFRTDDWQ
jgi:sialate O-acetylesterase